MYKHNRQLNLNKELNRKPRARLAQGRLAQPELLTLEVDMDAFYVWLGERLPREKVAEIRKVTSRDHFEEYCKSHAIAFVFG